MSQDHQEWVEREAERLEAAEFMTQLYEQNLGRHGVKANEISKVVTGQTQAKDRVRAARPDKM